MPEAVSETTIRLLTSADGSEYQQLRLRSLKEDSLSFLSSYEGESKLHEDAFARHLDWAYHPPHFGYFGVFTEHGLIGYVQVGKTFLEKQEHIAMISNLYVIPEYRGKGIADLLFKHVFSVLETHEHMERLFLTCAAHNKHAHRFYQKLGFRRYGVKVKSIKWHDQYDDEIEMVKVL
jgi:ribosomal protein S18 acetylase RimI-like enzyme